jgi:hypothetical protein
VICTGPVPVLSVGQAHYRPTCSDPKGEIMAIAFVFESDKVDQAGYDQLMQSIDREALDAALPAGVIAHLSGPKQGGGWRVVDVWESEDVANAFYSSEQFRPVMAGAADAGMSNAPWPLHRIEVAQTLRRLD